MNRQSVKKALMKAGVPVDIYHLGGKGRKDQKLCIEETPRGWLVYYSERGKKFDLSVYDSKEKACRELYRRLAEEAW